MSWLDQLFDHASLRHEPGRDRLIALLTGDEVGGGYTQTNILLTGTLAAGANLTLPTVASMITANPDLRAGDTFILRVINASSGAFSWTLVTNTGWTFTVTTATVAQNTYKDFHVSITSSSAAVIRPIGIGTYAT